MPKNEQQFQKETKLPVDSRMISRETEYPRIVSHVNSANAAEATTPSVGIATKTHDSYDESHGGEDNLHTQYVREGFIEHPSSFK